MDHQEQYHELIYYTLSHQSKDFIHQHIVDAFTAQEADKETKPIAIVYALAGLYLHIIKKYTGKEVQMAHVCMSKGSKQFEQINIPEQKGNITIKEVLAAQPGSERDQLIEQWCISVWDAYANEQAKVIAMTNNLLGIER